LKRLLSGEALPRPAGSGLLAPSWRRRFEGAPAQGQPENDPIIPRAPGYYAGRVTLVVDAAGVEALLDLSRQRPLAFVGLDTEFRYSRPPIAYDRKQAVHDCRSVVPLLLSLALAEAGAAEGKGTLYPFVIDLRVPEVLPALKDLLRLPVCFVGHYTHAELLCLWQLGLPEPSILWDTWAHEKALHLGRNHKKYRLGPGADAAEQARAAEEAEEEEHFGNSLAATCHRYNVPYGFAGDKERLQRSFLEHPAYAPFTPEQVEYATADAVAAARLYPRQVLAATQAGILHHLQTVEMPWVVTNARMVWRGVRIDADSCRRVEEACQRHLHALQPQLAALGVPNVRSHQQLEQFFAREGLLDLFRRDGKISFDKGLLDEFRDRHPAIPLIRAARRVYDLRAEGLLSGQHVGADGRVHPEHRQLGAHTGRQTCRRPNVAGLGRVFRPLVVPDPGRGLGEVDLSQIEVGVAGAVYHDAGLVEMFNTGDVYSAMAQRFYAPQLPEEDRRLTSRDFKRRHRDLRDRMKACTLGLIYGLTARGLALRLGVPEPEAVSLQEAFLGMFPTLRRGLEEAPAYGAIRGYAEAVSGLRRYRARGRAALTSWERNWLTNFPVQGSAAVVFKAAGNRLDRLYRRYDAWLVVPLHDAYVFEAPLEVLGEVAELTARVMCESVQDCFPVLLPQVEVNVAHPTCWNKEGRVDSIERWVEDPTFTF
jgi:DNA polymerase-1